MAEWARLFEGDGSPGRGRCLPTRLGEREATAAAPCTLTVGRDRRVHVAGTQRATRHAVAGYWR
jgi:hypothetical protein